jgi:hypothetical protein
MTLKRVILEMGAGNDLHGGDYTKAAVRAVQDALHHSSLTFIRSLGIDKNAAGRPDHREGREGRAGHPRRGGRRRRGHRQRGDRGADRPLTAKPSLTISP